MADLRDLIYRPSLGLLPARFLCAAVDPESGVPRILKIRHQGSKPSCIGEALAALIDIQRIETLHKLRTTSEAARTVLPASGPMLHAMALEIEGSAAEGGRGEIYSLRSGLKGFYNTGVCTEELWRTTALSHDRAQFDVATVAAMREARNVTLGAYYRVRSFINDYHAALVEAGALYVSAELHDGWDKPAGGVIRRCTTSRVIEGGHALVIVGYERDGFLVLNSWGEEWGGYAFAGRAGLPGIALWTYEDWASCVLDAWALRLAVPTPDSFRHTVDQQGAAAFGAGQPALGAPSVRRQVVLGRYIHLDDGRHVHTGSYPSSRQSLTTTLEHLGTEGEAGGAGKYDDIRLTLHGDTSATDDVMARAARSIPDDKRERIHGISLVWANALLRGASTALAPLFNEALLIAKGNRRDADKRIELSVRPVGRALWRDVKRAAQIAGKPGGDAADALAGIAALCAAQSKRLHIVTEGTGSLLLAELLRTESARRAENDVLATVLASLTLVAPLNTQRDFDETIGPFLEHWARTRGLRAAILKPDRHFDERLCVGAYSGSWTDLVRKALEEGPTEIVGAPGFKDALKGCPQIVLLPPPARRSGDLGSLDILEHCAASEHVRDAIKQARR
ncbi:C1 family peptidase [Roseomonas sp. CAU 1739]